MQDLIEVHVHYRRVFNQFFPEIKIHSELLCGHFFISRSDYNRIFR